MSFSQSHFQNAQNFQVYNGQFSNNALLVNPTINLPSHDSVSTFLLPHVVAGAAFDSDERYADGTCHEGTRQEMIGTIMDWATDTDTTDYILWLYGPAGAGKSALAQTICELLHRDYPEIYGGSFFFAHGPTDRGKASKLFTTLSYQLAIQFSSFRSEVNSALSRDPSLPTKSMKIQFDNLIARPLKRCRSLLSHNPVLVIDGLDECADDEGKDIQHNIVALIAEMIVDQKLPLRVLIASRPESCIRKAFDNKPLPTITQNLCLQDDEDAESDIEAYLIDGFKKIYQDNKRIMESVDIPWPSREVIDYLVKEASGQYIYVSTVLKFVGKSSKFPIPQKQLEIIISLGPHRSLAFSGLDRMYMRILSVYPRWETMKQVLEGLLVRANTTLIKAFLHVDPSELASVQDALSSLINIEEPEQSLDDYLFLESIFGSLLNGQDKTSFCHRSFREFLEDESRSGTFHIDLNEVRNTMLQGLFDIIHHNLNWNYEIEPHLSANIDHFTYYNIMPKIAKNCFRNCVLDCKADTLTPILLHMAERLMIFDLDHKSSDFLLHFMRDMEHLEDILSQREVRHRGNQTEMMNNFDAAWEKLISVVGLVQNKSVSALFLCTTFNITPTLVYFSEFKKFERIYIDEFSTIPETTDVISTIKQHRHFLCLSALYRRGRISILPNNLGVIRGAMWSEPHIRAEWNDKRIAIADYCLRSILNSRSTMSHSNYRNAITFLSARFFSDSKETSEICTKEYFQNPVNLSILASMTNLAAWTDFLGEKWIGNYLPFSILCWFNRQLTNPQTLKLLQDYDQSLQQRMTTIMKLIFEQHVLVLFSRSYRAGLCASPVTALGPRLPFPITMKVLPLPQGFHEEEDYVSEAPPNFRYWQSFHDKVFGEPSGVMMKGSEFCVLDPSCWHPHLASLLLNTLVRFLYGEIYPDYSTRGKYAQSFPYFTQSLPYAEPTPENLDALRAIVYLYPQLTPSWDPPEGFWLLLVELLQKYDHSVLSSEELDLFMSWLKSTDHADITTYIKV